MTGIIDQCSTPEMSISYTESEEWRKMRMAQNASHQDEVMRVTKQKNDAYSERNKVVSALAVAMKNLGYDVYRALHNPLDADWESDWRNILFIETPFGQLSWHFHDSEIYLISMFPLKDNKYDDHTTDEKYNRLLAFTITKGMNSARTRRKAEKESE